MELVRGDVVLTTNTLSLILIVIVLTRFTFRSVIHLHHAYIHSMAQGTLSLGGERITGACRVLPRRANVSETSFAF